MKIFADLYDPRVRLRFFLYELFFVVTAIYITCLSEELVLFLLGAINSCLGIVLLIMLGDKSWEIDNGKETSR